MVDGSENYTAENIQILEGLEGVRKRPAMYIGDIGKRGLHHLIYEIVDNSIDESLAGYCKNIEVIIAKDGSVSVKDDGRGIPTDIHPKTGKSALEVVTTTLHSGGKFEKKAYQVSGGLHGVGMGVVNGLSEWMEAEVHRNGKIYRQKYERGKAVTEVEVIGETHSRGTIIRFKPDNLVFKEIVFDVDYIKERLMELAFLNKTLSIVLKDERLEPKVEELFHYEGGIVQFVEYLNKVKNKLHPPFFYQKKANDVDVEFSFQYTDSYNEVIYSFVNDIKTIEGGTHLVGFKTALTRAVNEYLKEYSKKEERRASGEDAIEGITAVISIKVPEPQFEGQTKTKLGNSEVKGIVDSITYESVRTHLAENPDISKKIVDKVLNAIEAREAAQKAKELIRRKNIFETSILPGKLADCSEEDATKTELYLVEGDSAGGCFSGNTRIALLDGRSVTFEELVKEDSEGKQNFCYTIKNDGSVGVEEIKNPRITKRNAEVIKIILDNDEEITCTPDHKFMLRSGTYKEARDLKKEDSLMPLHKRISKVGGRITIDGSKMYEAVNNWNHKIRKIEYLTERIDVYDIEVPNTHNFALASGVFVHNSSKQARDRRTQAILPLRGKILNVEKAPIHKVLNSEEIRAIVLSLGCGFGEDFDLSKLRYHKVVIMTDADVDGSHIRTLLLTLFYRNFRKVVESGYIYIAQPPLYKVWKGKSVNYAYSDIEKDRFVAQVGGGASIQRYKGLGEMNPVQLWETTMSPENRTLKKVTIQDAIKADELFTILMGDEVPPRREFIEAYAKEVKNLDV